MRTTCFWWMIAAEDGPCDRLSGAAARWGDFMTAERDCAAQLGAAASSYGTGDIAEDME